MIPLSIPNICGNEWKYIKDCLDSNWVSSAGSYVGKFEQTIASYINAKYAVATSNGTSALHISLILDKTLPSDYVIVPNLTFVAPVNAIKYVGATPILIDIDPETLQLDLNLLENFLKENTLISNGYCFYNNKKIKSIIPVHVLGNVCNMEKLVLLAKEYHLSIIEDASEALGSFYSEKHVGTFGKTGCFSFNGNKIITTGGGGMIVTNDEILAKRARHLTTQAKISDDEYLHDEIGYNYRMVNILAALGVAQMENLNKFIKHKANIVKFYKQNLENIKQIRFLKIINNVSSNYWLITILTKYKKELFSYLAKNNIQARSLWVPINQLPMYKNEIYINQYDNSGTIYNQGICLPSSTNISESDILFICEKIREFFGNLKSGVCIKKFQSC